MNVKEIGESSTVQPEHDLYRHHSGRETRVQILESHRIGAGEVGEVFEVKALVQGRERAFVIKRFFDREDASGREMAERAFHHYKEAKAAGLKVFPTFRLSAQNGTVLMTRGYDDDHFCVSANNRGTDSLEDFGGQKLEEIPSFEILARAVMTEARIAADAGIFLPADAFFFVINKESKQVDFYIADVDSVQKVRLSQGQNVLEMNLTQADAALNFFIAANVADEDLGFRYSESLPRLRREIAGRR